MGPGGRTTSLGIRARTTPPTVSRRPWRRNPATRSGRTGKPPPPESQRSHDAREEPRAPQRDDRNRQGQHGGEKAGAAMRMKAGSWPSSSSIVKAVSTSVASAAATEVKSSRTRPGSVVRPRIARPRRRWPATFRAPAPCRPSRRPPARTARSRSRSGWCATPSGRGSPVAPDQTAPSASGKGSTNIDRSTRTPDGPEQRRSRHRDGCARRTGQGGFWSSVMPQPGPSASRGSVAPLIRCSVADESLWCQGGPPATTNRPPPWPAGLPSTLVAPAWRGAPGRPPPRGDAAGRLASARAAFCRDRRCPDGRTSDRAMAAGR